jgi:hypothetical protein
VQVPYDFVSYHQVFVHCSLFYFYTNVPFTCLFTLPGNSSTTFFIKRKNIASTQSRVWLMDSSPAFEESAETGVLGVLLILAYHFGFSFV